MKADGTAAMVLVPIDPTQEMVDRAVYAQEPSMGAPPGGSREANRLRRRARRIWSAMLAGAPACPSNPAADHQQAGLSITGERDPAYRVERERGPCVACGHGERWIVIGPDDVASGISFEDESDAHQAAGMLSSAFELGRAALASQPQAVEPSAMSRHSRAMLLNVIWHHQGGSSTVGQPLRAMLGIGQHDRLDDEQVSEAKRIEGLLAWNQSQPQAEDARDQIDRENVVLRAQRDHAQACLDRAVKTLTGIHLLLYPPDMVIDGTLLRFAPAEATANELMRAISERIRAIPDEIDAAMRSGDGGR